MITLIVLNILVWLGAFILTKKLYGGKGTSNFILSWFTLILAQIIIVELFLGLLGKLYLENIIFAHLCIFFVIFLTCRQRLRPAFIKPDTAFFFENKILLFAASVFLSFFCVKVWINLINPPICPESYQYHLSFPATWARNGNLNNPIVVFGCLPKSVELTALTYYPINAELLFFWLMLPLGNAFLADIAPVPFYFIGILAVYCILRKFALKNETALFIGFLWVLIPNVLKQIRNGTQLDLICAVMFLLVLNSLLIMNKELNLKNAILFAISLGIFIGTKVLNIVWFMALLPLCIYFLLRHLEKGSLKRIAEALLIILLGLFVFGAFSYVKTFILTGNPLYPIRFALFGKEIFPGIVDRVTLSKIIVDWREFNLRNLFFSEGLGLQFLVFIFPGTIIPFALFPWIRKRTEPLMENMLFFFAPFIMLALYLFYIKCWVRYFFPYLGMGFIAAAIFLSRYRWGEKFITFLGMICILSSAAELAHRNELIISLFFSFLLFFFLLLIRRTMLLHLRSALSLKNLLILLLLISLSLVILNRKYRQEEFLRYPAIFKKNDAEKIEVALGWKWLNENTGEGKRIAYAGRSEFYPLFGSKIKNDVLYISVNKKPNLPHYYSDGNYRKEKNLEAWLANLKDAGIDFLFVMLPYATDNESKDLKEFPIEDKWASSRPKEFKLVFSNNYTHIYKLLFK